MKNRWSKEADTLLLSQEYSNQQLAEMLGRTLKAIQTRQAFLRNPDKTRERLRKNNAAYKARNPGDSSKRNSSWTKEEDEALLAPNRPGDPELSKQLGRSIAAIASRRSRLLRKQR